MESDRWHQFITLGVVASLALGIVSIGIGIKALRKPSASPPTIPAAAVVAPTNGMTLSGTAGLDARSLSPGVTSVFFVASGGSLHDVQIAPTVVSLAGWLANWNTTTVANGTYQIVAVAHDASGHSARSSPVNVTVMNQL